MEKPTHGAAQPTKPMEGPMWRSKYRHLLDDPDVMHWFMERDSMSRIEVGMKIATYNDILDAKARRMKKGTVT